MAGRGRGGEFGVGVAIGLLIAAGLIVALSYVYLVSVCEWQWTDPLCGLG